MTDQDRPAFAHTLGLLGEAFNEPLSATRIEAYFVALGDLSWPQVERAALLVLREGRFFPKPVEVREAIVGTTDQAADAAWGAVLAQVRRVGYMGTPTFADPLTLPTIGRLWGSWRALCETLPAGGPELVGWIKQFKAVYVALATREAHEAPTGRALPAVTTAILAQVADLAARKAMPAAGSAGTGVPPHPVTARRQA